MNEGTHQQTTKLVIKTSIVFHSQRSTEQRGYTQLLPDRIVGVSGKKRLITKKNSVGKWQCQRKLNESLNHELTHSPHFLQSFRNHGDDDDS